MLHVWEELDEIFRLPLPTVIGPTRTNYPTNIDRSLSCWCFSENPFHAGCRRGPAVPTQWHAHGARRAPQSSDRSDVGRMYKVECRSDVGLNHELRSGAEASCGLLTTFLPGCCK